VTAKPHLPFALRGFTSCLNIKESCPKCAVSTPAADMLTAKMLAAMLCTDATHVAAPHADATFATFQVCF
jgi:hypothetical protein